MSSIVPPPPSRTLAPVPPKTVLLVDSHADSVTIYTTILEHHGFAVLAAEQWEDGVVLARDRRPDLIFMEFSLPRGRVMEAARVLRAHEATAHIPLVALSTAFAEADRQAALAAGFAAYLQKPCPPGRLLEEVRRILLLDPRAER